MTEEWSKGRGWVQGWIGESMFDRRASEAGEVARADEDKVSSRGASRSYPRHTSVSERPH